MSVSQGSVSHLDRHHAHHFESGMAEFEACKQGMWIFLVTEVLFFAGMFVAYAVLRVLPSNDERCASSFELENGCTQHGDFDL
jgi:cytochrome c oxidase subunit 3